MNVSETNLSAVVVFTPSEEDETRAFSSPTLAAAYEKFSMLAEESGATIYRASTRWYDQGQKKFRVAWHWDGKEWSLRKDVRPDVIYDKAATTLETRPIKNLLEENFPFINALAFSDHAGNKFLVNQTFIQFSKPYYRARSLDELVATLAQLPGPMAVVKPEQGNGGDGIFIMTKELLCSIRHSYPLLIQEFIDSSAGIPGVMKGLHDLRLIFCGEDLLYAYYRTPKQGNYLANVAQGGTQTMVDPEDLPHSIAPVIKTVQNHYRVFRQKIYTIDLMFDHTGAPWIVELNTMPGLYPDESERPHIHKLYRAIITTLREAYNKSGAA